MILKQQEYARRLYVKLNDEINTIEMDKKLNDVQKRIDEKKQKEVVPPTATNESTVQQTSESESSSN